MGNGKGVCLSPLSSNLLHFLVVLIPLYNLPYHFGFVVVRQNPPREPVSPDHGIDVRFQFQARSCRSF